MHRIDVAPVHGGSIGHCFLPALQSRDRTELTLRDAQRRAPPIARQSGSSSNADLENRTAR
jgi:hypothetical protein